MELSNFKLLEVINDSPLSRKYRASVTVTTKRFLRKAIVEHREIYRKYGHSWYFKDNGEYAPDSVDKLVRKLEAEKGKKLENCL